MFCLPSGNESIVTTYRVRGRPRFVRDRPGGPIAGHYEGEFIDADGHRLHRYLTDRGRAEILRLLERGERELSKQDFDDLTVEPTLESLVVQMEREGAVGA